MVDVRIVETPGLGDRCYLVTDGRVAVRDRTVIVADTTDN